MMQPVASWGTIPREAFPHSACDGATFFHTEEDDLEHAGRNNNGAVQTIAGKQILVANKADTWLTVSASTPFRRCSVGYSGENDGWQDLADNYRMDYEFDCVTDGNIALTGEIDLRQGHAFTLAVAFGHSLHNAVTNLLQSLEMPYEQQSAGFVEQWRSAPVNNTAEVPLAGDGGKLYRKSQSLLPAHEDKDYQGAMIASLSILWGQVRDGMAASIRTSG